MVGVDFEPSELVFHRQFLMGPDSPEAVLDSILSPICASLSGFLSGKDSHLAAKEPCTAAKANGWMLSRDR